MLGDLEPLLMPSWTLVFGRGYAKLHIFEPRQLRLVEHRMERDTGFGVVLLESGGEVRVPDSEEAPQMARFATLAILIDCSDLPRGRKGIEIEGCLRNRINVALPTADSFLMGLTDTVFPNIHNRFFFQSKSRVSGLVDMGLPLTRKRNGSGLAPIRAHSRPLLSSSTPTSRFRPSVRLRPFGATLRSRVAVPAPRPVVSERARFV